jgi:hypothetical protein
MFKKVPGAKSSTQSPLKSGYKKITQKVIGGATSMTSGSSITIAGIDRVTSSSSITGGSSIVG